MTARIGALGCDSASARIVRRRASSRAGPSTTISASDSGSAWRPKPASPSSRDDVAAPADVASDDRGERRRPQPDVPGWRLPCGSWCSNAPRRRPLSRRGRASLRGSEPLVLPDARVMLRHFSSHRWLLAVLVTSTLIAAVCTKLNTAGNLTVAAATTHVMVDDPDVSILERRALPQDVATLQKRAELYGRLMVTTPVLEAIGKRAGLPPDQIAGVDRTTADVPIPLTRAGQRGARQPDPRVAARPIASSCSPTPTSPSSRSTPWRRRGRKRSASQTPPSRACGTTCASIARLQGFPEQQLPQLRQLGSARGGTTNGKSKFVIGALTFFTAFGLSFVLLLLLAAPVPAAPGRRTLRCPPAARALSARAAADWPRTTRVLPWSVAGLITMFWLTPFDKIELAIPAPIDLTLDRLVLPVVVGVWLIAFTAGRGAAPRLRLTRVHLAIGVFLACAFVSVVLAARYLNQTGELMLALKKLPLLRLLHLGLRDRGELRAAHRGAGVPDVHPLPLGARRARDHLRVPLHDERVHHLVGQAAPRSVRAGLRTVPARASTASGGDGSAARRPMAWRRSACWPWRCRSPSSGSSARRPAGAGSSTGSRSSCCSPACSRRSARPR